jgi:hypothetical protein
VLAGSHLRHHAAVTGVDVHLRGDYAGYYIGAVLDDGGSRLIAGGLDAQYLHNCKL